MGVGANAAWAVCRLQMMQWNAHLDLDWRRDRQETPDSHDAFESIAARTVSAARPRIAKGSSKQYWNHMDPKAAASAP